MKSPTLGVRHAGALLLLTTSIALADPLWVSPTGDDTTGNGTATAPWKTIAKARDQIRALGLNSASQSADVIVNLRAGDYIANTPIAFRNAYSGGGTDSGQNGHAVIYRSVDGPGQARIVGAARLSDLQPGGWQVDTGSIWKINLGTGLSVGTLYENGARAWPARSPNLAPKARYPQYRGGYRLSANGGNNGTSDWIQYTAGDYDPSTWPSPLPATAQVMWWKHEGRYNWGLDEPMPLASVDVANRKLFFAPFPGGAPHHRKGVAEPERFFVQGLYQLLDAPGEFFYDAATGWLYYYPRDGNPNSQDIRVPASLRLVDIRGSGPGSANHAHHLTFDGIGFAYTNFAVKGTVNYDLNDVDGALYLQHTSHVQARNCEFANLGVGAVLMLADNRYNTLYGCWIHHCGVGGVWIANGLQRTAHPNDKSEHHLISNCRIHDLGEITCSAVATAGVMLSCTSDVEVSYCEISRSPRYATSLRGHWSTENEFNPTRVDNDPHDSGAHFAENNTFQYLRISDCVSDSGDAGAVHAAGVNGNDALHPASGPGHINYWSQILIGGAYADPSMNDPHAPDGIFLDHKNSTLFQSFSNVKIAFAQDTAGFRTNGNASQTTSNVSWTGSFNDSAMAHGTIGLKADFPVAFADRLTVIADSQTADYSESDGTWSDSSIGNLYGDDGRYHAYSGATPTPYAQWRPVLPLDGSYAVAAWKMDINASASNAAPYTIAFGGGTAVATVDQQAGAGGTWVTLGTYYFNAGGATIRLNTNTADAKAVRADAVKLTYVDAADSRHGGETGWWHFDNAATDSSGHGYNATLLNGASPTTGAAVGSHALALDGVNDYAEIADQPALDIGTGDFALSLWFYRTSNAVTNLRLLSKGAGLDSKPGYALFGSDSAISVAIGNGTARKIFSATYPGAGQWVHLALSIARNGNATLYLDGAIAASTTISDWSGQDLSSADALQLGRNVNSGSLYWPGAIDEVRVFKRQLSAAEVARLAMP